MLGFVPGTENMKLIKGAPHHEEPIPTHSSIATKVQCATRTEGQSKTGKCQKQQHRTFAKKPKNKKPSFSNVPAETC